MPTHTHNYLEDTAPHTHTHATQAGYPRDRDHCMILIRRDSWENIRGEEQKEADLNYGEVRLQCWPNDCLGQPQVGPGAKVPFRVDSRWDEGPDLHCNGWEPPRKWL